MNIILLSGGSGTRLWPLSNEVRSKQFLKIFKTENGHESMAQRMYRMIKDVDENASITIATSQNQVASIQMQLGDKVNISVEPCRRDTFPAIVLAAAFLSKQGINDNEPIIVCPVDPFVEKGYFECLKLLSDTAATSDKNLMLMGIEPTYPSEKYGYIIPCSKDAISSVKEFKEKPIEELAKKYISDGALWNGGIFAFKLGYVLKIAEDIFGTSSYDELFSKYDSLEKISFDYAVVEKESSIGVIRFDGQWKDLGTWNTLTEAMSDPTGGNVTMDMCENTHVINELSIPLIALGLKDVAVAATADGILVTDKVASAKLKDYASEVALRPMYEKRIWGEYKVLDIKANADKENYLTKELILYPGKNISYQIHQHRAEMWTFVKGEGKLVLDDVVTDVKRGDIAYITPGMKHAIKAVTELHIIEVQIGDELIEEDIERLDWDWKD